MSNFEQRLKGGHPNSLGNTIEIVEAILAKNEGFDELFNCYFSDDEVVRLRVSNAMKRIAKARKELLLPYMDRFIDEIAKIDQPSTKWTLAQLFEMLDGELTPDQQNLAKAIVKHNLETESDWIVLNQSMVALAKWSQTDTELRDWFIPHLKRLKGDGRNSVMNRANKLLEQLDK